MPRRRLRVGGVVQGVGFRPFVFNLAESLDLTGWVSNTSAGVILEIQGPGASLDAFATRLRTEEPPLARIVSVVVEDIVPEDDPVPFFIKPSENTPGTDTLIPADVATCADCLADMRRPGDRREGYAFTNCTNCGPRWTIISRIPYDRPFTSMAPFAMCPECQAEYDDPRDRRFHAQPNACPVCGPRVWLEVGPETFDDQVMTRAATLLADGRILALKGLGGFHLATDAGNEKAVTRLRDRKMREAKPLAVMAADLDAARTLGLLDGDAEALMNAPQSPIVLLPKREGTYLAPAVAPGHGRIGVMLPYTPLHHLLFDALAPHGVRTLVMTSGNSSDEPICLENDEARHQLGKIADGLLLHDRGIVRRADDSVVQILDGETHFFRRSRGYAPVPVFVRGEGADILAVGPELKNTVCVLKRDRAFLSPHIGDLENLKAFGFFEETIGTLQGVLETEPAVIAHDRHPGYFSTQWARKQEARGRRLVGVQHHHAHMVAVMAEHLHPGPVLGLIMDGTGYGDDGTIWGGEILLGDATGYSRLGHFDPAPLPGGDAAIKAPWRTAVSYLRQAFGDRRVEEFLPPSFAEQHVGPVLEMLRKNINSPLTSSCGRLFDAVAALTGRWSVARYEAQAAIELMTLTTRAAVEAAPPWPGIGIGETLVLPTGPLVAAAAGDVRDGATAEEISARFHATLIRLLTEAARRAAADTGVRDVVLGGGVFQNEILMGGLDAALQEAGLRVLRPVQVPANDGGVALGQAVIARATCGSA